MSRFICQCGNFESEQIFSIKMDGEDVDVCDNCFERFEEAKMEALSDVNERFKLEDVNYNG